jgi:hypothetical protein
MTTKDSPFVNSSDPEIQSLLTRFVQSYVQYHRNTGDDSNTLARLQDRAIKFLEDDLILESYNKRWLPGGDRKAFRKNPPKATLIYVLKRGLQIFYPRQPHNPYPSAGG